MTVDGSDRSFGAPRFDVVLRGYDRRQVDEHISRLQRVLGRMRTDLDTARAQVAAASPGPATPSGGRPRPTPRPRPDGSPPTETQDVVGSFTDRMHAILQAAEEEAGEIRGRAEAAARAEEERLKAARSAARAEEETARATVAELLRQRDEVLADLTRVRGQLEALLSGPTARITLPRQGTGPSAEARRETGSGQPLPGTPAASEPEATPTGERTVVAASRPSAAGRGPTGTRPGMPTAVAQAPTGASAAAVAPIAGQSAGGPGRSASGGRPDTSGSDVPRPDVPRPDVPRGPAGGGEQTMVAPAVGSAAGAPPAERTAVVAPAAPLEGAEDTGSGSGVEATRKVEAVDSGPPGSSGSTVDRTEDGDPEVTQVWSPSTSRSG